MNISQRASFLPRRFCEAIHVVLWAGACLGLAIALRAEEHLSYKFASPSKSVGTEGGVTISFDISSRDGGTSSATYSRRELIGETLADVKVVTFARSSEVTAADASAFFASLAEAGLWRLPKGDNYIGDGTIYQIDATIEGRDLHQIYNSPIKSGERKTLHAAVTGFAKKLGIDQPEDTAKATYLVEGDRTPAREIPFSSLITNPSRYDGKRIAVAGYYHREFECSALVPERFDWGTLDGDRMFWVGDTSKFSKLSDSRWKNDTWVRIEGVFSARHGGHMGGSPGVIVRVTKFTPLNGPPKVAAAGASNEDDPHDMEKLTLEIVVQPFSMAGRPIQEVVEVLNQQIRGQLVKRGLADDWLKIELDSSSNPKARVQWQYDEPETLRRILHLLGMRISPDEKAPFGWDSSTYMFVLPDVIRMHMKTSVYPDDKEPFSFNEEKFGDVAVRAKLIRYAEKTFRVEWQSGLKPEALRVSDALEFIRRILPDEPGAKSITGITITRKDAKWEWTATTDAAPKTASRPDADADAVYSSPMSHFAGREYVASLDAKTVQAAPIWNFNGELPLELKAALRAARAALKKIPHAEDSLRLEEISLTSSDDIRCAYSITFRDPAEAGKGFLTIPVLLSGKAITPKLETR